MARLILYSILIGGLLQGCGSGLLSVHRPDVQQGNAIEESRLEQVQIGMTQRQVRFLLGEPLLRDPFQGDGRWDYVYYHRPGNGTAVHRRVIIFFEDGLVSRIEDSGLREVAQT
ncbi:outer membrane protein assembly factor BamE [Ectothiorhodospira shaposhnikovii]|uniref:outer membrane protein assembly factor BamE n=1 Tax=Ectothiorhodospira shaposhnikovii TaxID=1054 RepID=UPI001EE8A79E|nr:outer membrane protein assembly factor BamE [Ectothiorhodospira shaposhnikovii]MCG5511761.1 outer membrane protein assembly factor BamE [Ectothiorhodospira shaposhnikovii]